MGKPYEAELAALPASTSEVLGLDIKPLTRAVEDASAHGLVIVASGGSQTAALYMATLHQARFGHPCRVVTPLVFRHDPGLARGNVWLLSAGGRNKDILGAADHAITTGAASVTALIASRDTPLQARLEAYGASRTFAYTLSTGGDGFLATNSLWSMCVLMERAYNVDSDGVIAHEVGAALEWAPCAVASVDDWDGTLVGLGDPDTMIGLQDLEMRATEAALSSIWVSDYRNLGHGRHYWFEAHRDRARALCLYTTPYEGLALRTAELLGSVSPVHTLPVPGQGRLARLASIAWSMYAALELGRRLNRDPGRPGVPAFGEALYELESPAAAPIAREALDDLVAAKLGRPVDTISEATRADWRAHLAAYRSTLERAEIRGVVADFDGTLIETAGRYGPIPENVTRELTRLLEGGLLLGIATGRGDSCGNALRRALPESLWPQVWIGYHNGTTIQLLAQRDVPDCPDTAAVPDIQKAHDLLCERVVGTAERGRVRLYPSQCSMTLLDGSTLEQAWARAHAALHELIRGQRVQIWMSSHSIDVVLHGVSKQAVISQIASAANCLPRDILTLGDRGRWPGNDTELLNHPLSLSADQCALAPDQCWNLAGTVRRQVAATCFHLSKLVITTRGVARYLEKSDE